MALGVTFKYLTLNSNDVFSGWQTNLSCARCTTFYLNFHANARCSPSQLCKMWIHRVRTSAKVALRKIHAHNNHMTLDSDLTKTCLSWLGHPLNTLHKILRLLKIISIVSRFRRRWSCDTVLKFTVDTRRCGLYMIVHVTSSSYSHGVGWCSLPDGLDCRIGRVIAILPYRSRYCDVARTATKSCKRQ